MRYASAAVAALALVAPAVASAAPFGELPSRAVRQGISCLDPTAEPGTLAHDAGFEAGLPGRTVLLRAGRTGLEPGPPVPATPYGSCTELALRPGGAGVAAYFYAEEPGESGVRAVLREGGAWGAPAELIDDPGVAGVDALAAGVSDAGAAVVAAAGNGSRGFEATAYRRAPGGGFGATETLMRGPAVAGTVSLRAGVTSAGETVVAWSSRPRRNAPRQLWATYAAPGGAFHAPVRIGAPRGPFALAVGDGGHALLAFAADQQLRVAERGPGAGFGPSVPVGVADDPLIVFPAAAVRPDGAAVVGWADFLDGAVRAVTRVAPGAFGAQVQLARRVSLGFDRALFDESVSADFRDGDLPFEEQFQPVGAGFAGARALVAWTATTRRDGVYAMAPSVAVLPPGGPLEVHAVGNGLRDVVAVTPLALADGAAAVAWAGEDSGRLHLAVEGAPGTPEAPGPTVRIGPPTRRVLRAGDELELPVTCSAACDVRASSAEGVFDGTNELTLRRAGSGTVTLRPEARPIARLDGAPVPVYVRFGAPGTAHPHSRTVMVRLRRPPSPPPARVRGVRARRSGDDVVVTWRSDRDADDEDFFVYATAERGGDVLRGALATGSARRFRARVRDVAGARFVTILAGDLPGLIRRTTVEID